MNKYFIVLLLLLSYSLSQARSAGDYTYSFLNLTNSARVAGLGGQQISIFDDDLNMAFHNPALLNGSMSDHIVMNYVPYIADIGFGYFSYAKTYNKIGNLGMGIHYIDYGSFIGADEYSNLTGDFFGREYSVNFYYSRPVFDSLFQIGGTLKYINSHLEMYRSWGLAMDAGISYASENHLFGAALVMKNLGSQMTKYYDDANHEPLPFEVQFGISQKLEHAPFRICVTFRNLETPNLRYETDAEKEAKNEKNLFTGQTKKEDKVANFTSNVLRHTVFGVEILPSKYLTFQIGYNYRRRQELKIPEKTPGFIGFSWGMSLKLKNINISYGRVRYHYAGVSNHISIGINLSGFKQS
jgi:hypothetical protein